MPVDGLKSLPAIGFLSVCAHSDFGLFGGYLILNAIGRPMEFHCTAPIKPTRAQEILYGPTLEPYLYGEQIGQTLLQKAKVPAAFVCTDVEPALAVREMVRIPVALIDAQTRPRLAAEHSTQLLQFELGQHVLAIPRQHHADQASIAEAWRTCGGQLDLHEPFVRIRSAIEEAQRGGRAA